MMRHPESSTTSPWWRLAPPNGDEPARRPHVDLRNAACAQDGDAFRRLVEPYRTELRAHCYRILGSTHDAEDALQEVMLRAWRGLDGLKDGKRLRPWLYKIATNTCIDQIRRRPKGVLPINGDFSTVSSDHGWPIGHSRTGAWLGNTDGHATPEARCEEREALELAYVAALQYLPGRQRAVLILREVLGYSARQVAELLETTVASVNSALQRARKTINDRKTAQCQLPSLRRLGNQRVHDVERFIEALQAGNVDGIVAGLANDVRIAGAARTP
jgi:RNA polymerase sigma-70 factor (ECF subfamily)